MCTFIDFDTLLFILKVSFEYIQHIKGMKKYISSKYVPYNQAFSDNMHFEVNSIQREKEILNISKMNIQR